MRHGHKNLLVALAGQPNSGKSTIFNMLTGAHQHVANFPGVTVEKKWGGFTLGSNRIELVDLPGTYSLTSYTQEERVARDFILLEQPEAVVAVVDASNLERNLYLVFQLREMGVPMVLCLNMMDVAERRGFRIDCERLSELFGSPVIPTVGKRGRGGEALKQAILDTCGAADHGPSGWKLDYGPDLEPVVEAVAERLRRHEHLMEDFSDRWLAVKLLENDAEARRILLHHTHDEFGQELCDFVDAHRRTFVDDRRKSIEKLIASRRFQAAAGVIEHAVQRSPRSDQTLTDRIDAVVLNRAAAMPIMALILFLFYQLTMGLGTWLSEACVPWFEQVQGLVASLLPGGDLLRSGLLESLVVEGVLGGVIAILEYVPIFFVLFLLIAVLEDTGYMARMAFIMDRVLRAFGLHGQSTLPLILGGVIVGGCAAPGVMATRAMKDEKARLITILIMPLMNCMAKIPFYILIVGIFFAGQQGLVLFLISVFSFSVAMLVARVFSRFLVRGRSAPFLMELPAYHWPTLRGVLSRALERLWQFVKKVLTVIVAVMVIVWFLVLFPGIGHERETYFDRQLEALKTTLVAEAGADNPYAPLLAPERLDAGLRLRDRYLAHKEAAAHDPQALRRTVEAFHATHRDLFLVVNAGVDADGKVDADARRAGQALGRFVDGVDLLKRQRSKEVISASYAGRLGQWLEPVTRWAGFNWRLNIAILSSFAAKEALVGSLGTIYSVEGGDVRALSKSIQATETGWTTWHALAILAFVALFPPCLPTLVVIKVETGSWRWTVFAALYPVVIGFALAVLVFQIGSLAAL